jgi:amino acid transporter
MDNLNIRVLPHIVNACILTSVFSSGNGDIYAVSRAVFGMSLDGKAPKFLSRTLSTGVPIYSVIAGLTFCALGFLQVSTSSAKVVSYLVSLVTSCQMLNYGATVVVYLHFFAACKAQGVDRDTLPYKSRFQPYTSYVALFGCGFALLANGWANFVTTSGSVFSVRDFFLNYAFVGVFPILFVFWKVWKKTKYIRPEMVDLTFGGVKGEIDRYEETYVPKYTSKVSEWIDTKVF